MGVRVSVCIIVLTESPSPYSDDHHVFKELNRVRTGELFSLSLQSDPKVLEPCVLVNRVHGFSCT